MKLPFPDWSGPAIPTGWDDVPNTVAWSVATGIIYRGIYEWELSRTLSRMPNHAFRNPSRAAVLREAALRTPYPSVTRGFGLAMRIFPAFNFVVTGLTVVSLLGYAQREGWLGLGGNAYEGPLPDDWQGVPLYKAEGPTYTR